METWKIVVLAIVLLLAGFLVACTPREPEAPAQKETLSFGQMVHALAEVMVEETDAESTTRSDFVG